MKTKEYLNLSKEDQKKIPFKAQPLGVKIGGFVIIVLFLLILTFSLRSCLSDPEPPKIIDKIIATVVHEEFVKLYLKSPSTAEFGNPQVYLLDSTNVEIQSYVDSQNSFGAILRTNYIIDLKWTGGDQSNIRNWIIKDFNTY